MTVYEAFATWSLLPIRLETANKNYNYIFRGINVENCNYNSKSNKTPF